MRLSELKTIQELPKIKRFKPIPKPTLEEWETGDIIDGIQICLLISRLLFNLKIKLDDENVSEFVFISYMTAVKLLFQKDKDQGYIMQKEFNQIKKDFNIRFDED